MAELVEQLRHRRRIGEIVGRRTQPPRAFGGFLERDFAGGTLDDDAADGVGVEAAQHVAGLGALDHGGARGAIDPPDRDAQQQHDREQGGGGNGAHGAGSGLSIEFLTGILSEKNFRSVSPRQPHAAAEQQGAERQDEGDEGLQQAELRR